MSVRTVKIGDLALNERGAFKIGPFGSSLKKSELVNAGVPVVGIENVLPNRFEKGFRRFVAPAKFEELSDYKIIPDDVLVTTMGTIGRAAVVPPKLGKAIIDSHLFRMRVDTDRVFPPYLCYAINSSVVDLQLQRMARGAIMQGLNTTILQECEIPLPKLPEQKRIAALLEQVDRLRRTRRYALELSDTFLPAAFLKLFGDPVRNDKGWPKVVLLDVCENITDGTHDTPDRVESGVPFITSKNIRPFEFDLTDLEFVTPATHREIIKRCNPRYGDVLYTNIGVNVGNAVANRLRFEFSLKNVALIQLDFSKLNTGFLEALLNNAIFKEAILRVSSVGGAQKFVSLEVLRGIEIILPPQPVQQKFAGSVERVERLRLVQRESLRQADHLFQSLLHRAFAGPPS